LFRRDTFRRNGHSTRSVMRPDDLMAELEDRPFRPFRIHLSDGTLITVSTPGMVMVGTATAVLPTRVVRSAAGRAIADTWQTIALRHIVRFSDVKASTNGRHPRKKRA